MTPYRVARRSFLAGIGGAFGLRILLENVEAAAEGQKSPPRFLLAHWPLGTIPYHFLPSGSGATYQTSRILRPFEDSGLREDMIVLHGLDHSSIGSGGGGAHEAGTVASTTGASSPGTRQNGGEADDSCAGGPSFDQIFLRHVRALARPGVGYANAICDARVESLEASTQCLSYGYQRRAIQSARPGGVIEEHAPLVPTLSPLRLYTELFSGFVPGPGGQTGEMLKALRMRKSVLDSALRELARLGTLVPESQRIKIDVHAEAIRKIEMQLSTQITNGAGTSCVVPPSPDPSITGKASGRPCDFCPPTTVTGDNELHEAVGRLHLSTLRAAFQCDLIRVATFQWAPGTSQVAFKGLDPTSPNTVYRHHPQSHRITNAAVTMGPPPASTDSNASTYEFLANVHTWYNTKMAALLREFKDATDAFGSSLLDHTIVPFITEVAEAGHTRGSLPALVFGGKALGMRGGQFAHFTPSRPHNDLWATIAQAYFGTSDPLATAELRGESFVKEGVSPIPGLWAPPA